VSARRRAVSVVGIGADGCASLTARAFNAISAAHVLVGGERHLSFFPDFAGERVVIKGAMGPVLEKVAALSQDRQVCVLASGDPFFYGVGRAVVDAVGAEHVDVVPNVSSAQWAFAKVGESWHDAAFVSVHGRTMRGLSVRLRHARKAALLTDAEHSPPRIAAHLLDYGDRTWRAWVCENLAGDGERVRSFTLEDLAKVTDVGALNVLLLVRDATWRPPASIPYRPEDSFARRMPKKGLITKREVRILSFAALDLRPADVVWDIGAGSGAVAIEAALLAYEGRTYAVEVEAEGASICRDNVRSHGADNVEVIEGRAPDALAALESPDAVFIGGSKGSMQEIIDVAWKRLSPGGRIVANAITLDNVGEAYRAFRELGVVPDVALVQISRGEPLAHYLRYEALNPIHIFSTRAPNPSAPAADPLRENHPPRAHHRGERDA
jgi:precorrin-6Y C5,15-methyltransferase (decarboxylating)